MKKEESSAKSSSDSSTDSVIPGKVFDGQYYVAYQVLRDKITADFTGMRTNGCFIYLAGWKCFCK